MARQPPQAKPLATKSVPPLSTIPDVEATVRDALDGVVSQGAMKVAVERVTALMVSEHFSGPLPHPKHIAGYEGVLPGSADRIIKMAEKAVDSRLSLQDRAVQADIADRKLGMYLGAGCFGGLVVAALISNLLTGGTVVPGIFLGVGAVGGVTAFINGRLRDRPPPQAK